MSWTFTTETLAVKKAGANANSTITADSTTLAAWSEEAEALINDTARVDLVTNYSSLTDEGKQILGMIESSYVAKMILSYEPEAIGVQGATLRINILENNIRTGLALIKEDKVKTYLNAT